MRRPRRATHAPSATIAPSAGRGGPIAYNRTAKGRARIRRFEDTPHRREYKALSTFGTPYKDLDVTAALAVNLNKPSWGAEKLKRLKFRRISQRCPHCTKLGRKNPSMSIRRIPIS